MSRKAILFEALLSSLRNSSQEVLAGGTIEFYHIGTDIAKDVFEDRERTISAGSIVTLGNDGSLLNGTPIFLDGLYKIKVKDSVGTLIATIDGVGKWNTDGVWYDVADYDDLNDAVTSIGSTVCDLLITSQVAMSNHVTIPSTMTLKFTKDGSILQNAFTLTINGGIDAAPDIQIFDSSTAIAGTPKVDKLHIKWWGVKGDGSTDDTAAIQRAFTFLPDGYTLKFPNGTFRTTDELLLYNKTGSTIEGSGCVGAGTWIMWDAGVAASTKATIKWKQLTRCHLRHMIMAPAVTAESSGFGLYITNDGGVDQNTTSHNLFFDLKIYGFTGNGIQLGHYSVNADVTVDHNTFFKCTCSTNTNSGIRITQTNTNNTSLRDCSFSENTNYGVELGDTGSPRDILIDNCGLSGNAGAHVYYHNTFSANLTLRNLMVELSNAPLLSSDAATTGWNPSIGLYDVRCTYNGSGYDIINFNSGGILTMMNCQFAGSGDPPSGTDARIRVQPVAHADNEARLITANVILTTGASWDVASAGNARVRWIRLGDSYSANSNGDVVTINPVHFEHIDIHNSLSAVDQPTVTGVTLNKDGLIGRRTFKFTVAKEAWYAAATTQTITICTYPPRTRLVSIIVNTTVAYAGLAGTIQLQADDVGTGGDLINIHDVKTATVVKGLADADLGATINRATAVQGGYISGWAGNAQVSLTLTSGTGNIGDGANTNLSAGETVVYITVEVLN